MGLSKDSSQFDEPGSSLIQLLPSGVTRQIASLSRFQWSYVGNTDVIFLNKFVYKPRKFLFFFRLLFYFHLFLL